MYGRAGTQQVQSNKTICYDKLQCHFHALLAEETNTAHVAQKTVLRLASVQIPSGISNHCAISL